MESWGPRVILRRRTPVLIRRVSIGIFKVMNVISSLSSAERWFCLRDRGRTRPFHVKSLSCTSQATARLHGNTTFIHQWLIRAISRIIRSRVCRRGTIRQILRPSATIKAEQTDPQLQYADPGNHSPLKLLMVDPDEPCSCPPHFQFGSSKKVCIASSGSLRNLRLPLSCNYSGVRDQSLLYGQ